MNRASSIFFIFFLCARRRRRGLDFFLHHKNNEATNRRLESLFNDLTGRRGKVNYCDILLLRSIRLTKRRPPCPVDIALKENLALNCGQKANAMIVRQASEAFTSSALWLSSCKPTFAHHGYLSCIKQWMILLSSLFISMATPHHFSVSLCQIQDHRHQRTIPSHQGQKLKTQTLNHSTSNTFSNLQHQQTCTATLPLPSRVLRRSFCRPRPSTMAIPSGLAWVFLDSSYSLFFLPSNCLVTNQIAMLKHACQKSCNLSSTNVSCPNCQHKKCSLCPLESVP